ncbi:cytochrome d ubiquinol oxidase subunit II, partial [Escherichia coli]|uniref:cytochrome d ubiquinol oxidase subunit II n=1 Tax=Escherichia coli TaxID=562 RepID=UPI00202E272E
FTSNLMIKWPWKATQPSQPQADTQAQWQDALAIPLTLMLIGLIFRGVAFEFRFKATPEKRHIWDKAFIWGSV